jgi:hypothetical protein
MQLDHSELRPQIGFGLSWIERAARVEPFGRHAPELTALRLCHMSQLVGQEFVDTLGAGRVLATCKVKVDVVAESERARVVRHRDQIRGVVGVQPCRSRRLWARVRPKACCDLVGQHRACRAVAQYVSIFGCRGLVPRSVLDDCSQRAYCKLHIVEPG